MSRRTSVRRPHRTSRRRDRPAGSGRRPTVTVSSPVDGDGHRRLPGQPARRRTPARRAGAGCRRLRSSPPTLPAATRSGVLSPTRAPRSSGSAAAGDRRSRGPARPNSNATTPAVDHRSRDRPPSRNPDVSRRAALRAAVRRVRRACAAWSSRDRPTPRPARTPPNGCRRLPTRRRCRTDPRERSGRSR